MFKIVRQLLDIFEKFISDKKLKNCSCLRQREISMLTEVNNQFIL